MLSCKFYRQIKVISHLKIDLLLACFILKQTKVCCLETQWDVKLSGKKHLSSNLKGIQCKADLNITHIYFILKLISLNYN